MWPCKYIDMGIDLGTSKFSIYARGEGLIVTEPAYIAFEGERLQTSKILEIGAVAKQMLGKCPAGINVMSPMRDGVIIDTDAARILLQEVARKAKIGRWLQKRRILVGSLLGSSSTERRAFLDVARSVAPSEIRDIPEPLAAAAGCGLAIEEPRAQMIVDIGSGATEIVVVSLGDIVAGSSLRVGGDAMDEHLVRHVFKEYGIRIGNQAARVAKEQFASMSTDGFVIPISGTDTRSGLPRNIHLTAKEIRKALASPIDHIVSLVKSTVETLPPEISADVLDNGISLSGGSALLPGIRERIAASTCLNVSIAERPSEAVVRGCGRLLGSSGFN